MIRCDESNNSLNGAALAKWIIWNYTLLRLDRTTQDTPALQLRSPTSQSFDILWKKLCAWINLFLFVNYDSFLLNMIYFLSLKVKNKTKIMYRGLASNLDYFLLDTSLTARFPTDSCAFFLFLRHIFRYFSTVTTWLHKKKYRLLP